MWVMPVIGLSAALNGIPVRNRTNFKNWKERIMIVLGCLDLDHAFRLDRPAVLTDGSSNVDRIAYEKRERSNRMCHDHATFYSGILEGRHFRGF
ncbi:Retrovirus-related Pol polyprotein from transposon TNT 1-94 [Senna tora]|uniref:Retrovirus-related Pol polyprotein from transposon TNT 1-94 n=1 Tax=Senna tora TaxID=362788 RepID=A0A834W9F1_9FABA|nr:Retrovirus-related Pol polyprotein from transposon TNT 1-94 [Senna tora]